MLINIINNWPDRVKLRTFDSFHRQVMRQLIRITIYLNQINDDAASAAGGYISLTNQKKMLSKENGQRKKFEQFSEHPNSVDIFQ